MLLVEPEKLEAAPRNAAVRAGDLGDVLEARLKFCAEDDQLLIEMLYKHNLSRRQIGRLVKRSPGAVSRRLRNILNRLHDPLVIALTDSTCTLPDEYREVGIAYFLQDLSVPVLMRRLHRSRREVDSMVEYVRGWHRGISGKP